MEIRISDSIVALFNASFVWWSFDDEHEDEIYCQVAVGDCCDVTCLVLRYGILGGSQSSAVLLSLGLCGEFVQRPGSPF